MTARSRIGGNMEAVMVRTKRALQISTLRDMSGKRESIAKRDYNNYRHNADQLNPGVPTPRPERPGSIF